MTKRSSTLARAAQAWRPFDDQAKQVFHAEAKKALRAIVKALGLEKGEFDLRSNPAGPAVSGEVTLHADHWYVQVAAERLPGGVLFRLCNGRKDYCGFQNHWADLEALAEPEAFVAKLRGMLRSASAQSCVARSGAFEITDAALARHLGPRQAA